MKRTDLSKMEKIFKYFFIFSYSPTFEEIYTFYPKSISEKQLKILLSTLEKKKRIYFDEKSQRYTLGEYSIRNVKCQMLNVKTKFIISQKKLAYWRFRLYIKILSLFSQIKLIGLSGSIAMMNAKEEDDIDLFIITAQNRLFTGRFIAIILAKILGIHRGYKVSYKVKSLEARKVRKLEKNISCKNKVCLNLFFDEKNLKIPLKKHTFYVAHEVLQMKPIINKNHTYEKFLYANRWVFRLFPNSKSKIKNEKLKLHIKNQNKLFDLSRMIFNLMGNSLESLLKRVQLFFINRHRTTEIITSTQLWFHPDDFEKKIKV